MRCKPFKQTRYIGLSIGLALVILLMNPAQGNIGIPAPEFTNPTWLNSKPLTMKDLRGKVVLLEFWTFGCSNCRNIEPYIKIWQKQYEDRGLVIIAVHSPEFSYEEPVSAVEAYLREHEISYPVPIDNEFVTWKKYRNRYWPTIYLIDKQGIIRHIKIGEGGYDQTEDHIRRLLEEPS